MLRSTALAIPKLYLLCDANCKDKQKNVDYKECGL